METLRIASNDRRAGVYSDSPNKMPPLYIQQHMAIPVWDKGGAVYNMDIYNIHMVIILPTFTIDLQCLLCYI